MAKKKRSNNNRVNQQNNQQNSQQNNQAKVEVKVKENSEELNKSVNSVVKDLEKTRPIKKFDDIEELQTTVEMRAIKQKEIEEYEKRRKEEEERKRQEEIERKQEEEKKRLEEIERRKQEQQRRLEELEKKKQREEQEYLEELERKKQLESSDRRVEDFEEDLDFPEKKEENLTKIGSYRFEFQEKKSSDIDSLDTSFLEGRIKNVPKSGNKPVAKKVVKPQIRKSHLFARILTCAIVLVLVSFLLGFAISYRFAVKTEVKIEKEEVIKEVKVADDNYVFLGDSITDFYDLDEYYKGLPVINSGINGNNTQQVLNTLNDRVYRYNPSKVFILIGTNDYISLRRNESIKENVTKIVEEIHKNRPLCKIYIESLTPVTIVEDDKVHEDFVNARDNDEIVEANKILENISKDTNSTFINLYDLFYDEEEGLKLDYTKDGLHLNSKGYEVLTNEIMKYIKA